MIGSAYLATRYPSFFVQFELVRGVGVIGGDDGLAKRWYWLGDFFIRTLFVR